MARDALAWYAGELLPADRYEDWAADRRELLALRRLDLLRIAGDWRDLAEVDPTHEEAHLRLMERQIDEGDVVAAVRQYDHLARVLERELGVEPNAAVRQARHHAGALLGLDLSSGNSRVARVLAELTGLVHRQGAILAELSSRCGCPSETFRNAVGA